jgi:hypothetical protein
VLKDFGEQAIVGSICARNVDAPEQQDFGYRPAVEAIVDRLDDQLSARCTTRALAVNLDGSAACTLIEAQLNVPPAACSCDQSVGRVAPTSQEDGFVRGPLSSRGCGALDPACQAVCLCKVQQVHEVAGQGALELERCQFLSNPGDIDGWCYVADTVEQPNLGNPDLVAVCPPEARRLIRSVGYRPNAEVFVVCANTATASL